MRRKVIFFVLLIFFISNVVFSQEVVQNTIDAKKKLRASDVILEKELEIGGQKQEGEYLFEDIRSFRVDEEGNIYVIDVKAKKLMKFGKQGKLIWKIGKAGQGPGEFQLLLGIELGKNKSILVNDVINRRISYFSREGELLEEISTADQPITLYVVDDNSKGIFYGTIRVYLEGKDEVILSKFDHNFNAVKQLYKLEIKRNPKEVYVYPLSIRFRVRSDDKIIYASSWEYNFYLADVEGNVEKIIRNKYSSVKLTQEDRKRLFEEIMGGEDLPSNRKFIIPDYYPPIEHLLIDDQNNIFVRTYERTKDGAHYYDYFDAEGRYIASFPMKETIFCIRGDRFYTLEEDEEGYQKIVRYRYRLKLK